MQEEKREMVRLEERHQAAIRSHRPASALIAASEANTRKSRESTMGRKSLLYLAEEFSLRLTFRECVFLVVVAGVLFVWDTRCYFR